MVKTKPVKPEVKNITQITITPSPTLIPTPSPTPAPKLIHFLVPFTSQSPFAQWSDPRQQDACEEASALMAVKWARNETIKDKQSALDEILDIADYETKNFGNFHDTSVVDTVARIFKGYYQFNSARAENYIFVSDIIAALQNGDLVITPMNGRALKNPHFTSPGPERHMVVIIGYDPATGEFITNDPGIAEGKDYHYPIDVFYSAIRDYPTGFHVPIERQEKNMIVIKKV